MGFTVTVHDALAWPALAVMATWPSFTAVMVPFSSTVATAGSEDSHVTVFSVASSGSTSAFSRPVSPSTSVSSVLSSVTSSTAT